MKRMFKKAISVFLVVTMLFCAAPLNGFIRLDLPSMFDFKAEAASYSGACGDNLTWTLYESGLLEITGKGTMKNYTYDSTAPWYSYRSSVKTIVIGNDVTTISDYAFYGCTSITSVAIPNSITSIGDDAFYGCNRLTSITIPDNVTSIGEYAFGNCESLASITIPNSITSIRAWSFYNCAQLESITIPGNVKTIGKYAFFSCDNLVSVTIQDGVTTIDESAFVDCYKLKNITIPDSIIKIGGDAFYCCSGIKAVYYPGTPEQWSLVTVVGAEYTNGYFTRNIVYECNSDRPYYFGSCGSNVKWKLFTDGELIISGTGAMNSWNDWANVPWYYHRSIIKSITISDGVTSIGRFAFYAYANLTSVTIPDSVTTIGAWAFYRCISLTNVTIPNSITTIGDDAFYGCTSLASVTIPDSVTTIGDEAFTRCNSLTNITVDADNKYYSNDSYGVLFNKDKTTLIQYPAGNTRISYTIPNSTTTIGDYAFYDCDSLVNVTIPNDVTTIGFWAFLYCDNLENINVSADNLYYSSDSHGVLFNKDKTTLIQYPIGNTRISYTIPDSVTTIGENAFYDCTGLISVTIGNGVTTIGYYAFEDCTGLISITIPDSVETIGENAFAGCTNLTSVTIGSSVTLIDCWAFCDCDSLSDVYYGGTEEEWNKIYIALDNEPLNNATIHFNYNQHTHTYEWFVESAPAATQDGLKKKICLDCGDEAESAVILATGFEKTNGMVVDYANNIVYGLAPGVDSLDCYTDIVADSAEWVYTETQNGFGTGTIAKLQADGEIIGEYTIVVFGDIQGDGWYDAEDAFLVGLIVNGLLTEENLPEYMLKAADCNHDGVINELDFDLLIGAGVKKNDIDQNATQEEFVTQSEYIEYASLIDQSAGMHTGIISVPDVDNSLEDTTVPETNETDEFNVEVIIANLFEFITKIFELIFSFVI